MWMIFLLMPIGVINRFIFFNRMDSSKCVRLPSIRTGNGRRLQISSYQYLTAIDVSLLERPVFSEKKIPCAPREGECLFINGWVLQTECCLAAL